MQKIICMYLSNESKIKRIPTSFKLERLRCRTRPVGVDGVLLLLCLCIIVVFIFHSQQFPKAYACENPLNKNSKDCQQINKKHIYECECECVCVFSKCLFYMNNRL